MVKTLNQKLSELPAARRERILTEADRLHAEYVTLQELRKARKSGGEAGIRTLGGLAPSLDFESSPFNRSGTSPKTGL